MGYTIPGEEELIEKIKQYILTMLRMPQTAVCRDDPRAVGFQSAYMPATHQSIIGHSSVDDGGDVTAIGGDVIASSTIEAFWFSNAYVPPDDKTGG